MKTVAFTFGRMNPFTTGHLLVCKKLQELNADKKYVYLSHTQDKPKKKNPLMCKNPLPYDIKILYAKEFIDESNISKVEVRKSEAKTVLDALHELYLDGFERVILIVGSDRIDDFSKLINTYNGYINKDSGEIAYQFDEIEFESAGERIDDGNDVSAMSASKLRKLAYEENFEEFKKGVPTTNENIALDLYNDVRKYMGL